MNVVPGCHTVKKNEIARMHTELIRGLVLLEGSLPVSHLNPAMHHFVHYAEYTRTHGPPKLYWMMGFERCMHTSMHADIAL